MLFRPRDLERIAAGEITLAFRRWERPRVKPGSRQRTPIGVIAFDTVEVVEEISHAEARAAGFDTPEQVHAALPPRGPIHRVELRLEGPDPRVALRETPPDHALFAKLDRMGPWTYEYLRLIAGRPGVRAGDLAEAVGRERLEFKRDVRKPRNSASPNPSTRATASRREVSSRSGLDRTRGGRRLPDARWPSGRR